MKIAILSDIHANLEALAAVEADLIAQKDIAAIWFLGDLFGYLPNPLNVYDMMRDALNPEFWLVGNHDLSVANNSQVVAWMPEKEPPRRVDLIHREIITRERIDDVARRPATVQVEREHMPKIVLSHGLPGATKEESVRIYDYAEAPLSGAAHDQDRLLERRQAFACEAQVWLVGHSHRQTAWAWSSDRSSWRLMADDFGQTLDGKPLTHRPLNGNAALQDIDFDFSQEGKESLVLINPGSVGWPRDGLFSSQTGRYYAKYLVMELDGSQIRGQFRAVPYDAGPVVRRLKENYYPKTLIADFTGEDQTKETK